jgi:hypothetical protein
MLIKIFIRKKIINHALLQIKVSFIRFWVIEDFQAYRLNDINELRDW